MQQRLQREKQLLDYTVTARFYRRPRERVQRARERSDRAGQRLQQSALQLLKLKGLQLAALEDKLEGASPLKLMARGYSFCQDEEGNVVRSIGDLQVGERLQLRFRDGTARCRIEELEEGSELV